MEQQEMIEAMKVIKEHCKIRKAEKGCVGCHMDCENSFGETPSTWTIPEEK